MHQAESGHKRYESQLCVFYDLLARFKFVMEKEGIDVAGDEDYSHGLETVPQGIDMLASAAWYAYTSIQDLFRFEKFGDWEQALSDYSARLQSLNVGTTMGSGAPSTRTNSVSRQNTRMISPSPYCSAHSASLR